MSFSRDSSHLTYWPNKIQSSGKKEVCTLQLCPCNLISPCLTSVLLRSRNLSSLLKDKIISSHSFGSVYLKLWFKIIRWYCHYTCNLKNTVRRLLHPNIFNIFFRLVKIYLNNEFGTVSSSGGFARSAWQCRWSAWWPVSPLPSSSSLSIFKKQLARSVPLYVLLNY